jgi:hypothetical protein
MEAKSFVNSKMYFAVQNVYRYVIVGQYMETGLIVGIDIFLTVLYGTVCARRTSR